VCRRRRGASGDDDEVVKNLDSASPIMAELANGGPKAKRQKSEESTDATSESTQSGFGNEFASEALPVSCSLSQCFDRAFD
jgi:hypothetical protein